MEALIFDIAGHEVRLQVTGERSDDMLRIFRASGRLDALVDGLTEVADMMGPRREQGPDEPAETDRAAPQANGYSEQPSRPSASHPGRVMPKAKAAPPVLPPDILIDDGNHEDFHELAAEQRRAQADAQAAFIPRFALEFPRPASMTRIPEWRLARARAAGQTAGDVLSGRRRLPLPSSSPPPGERLPDPTIWVVLRPARGEPGAFTTWREAATRVRTQASLDGRRQPDDPYFDETALFHSWASLAEAWSYIAGARYLA